MGWVRRNEAGEITEWARNAAVHLTEEIADDYPDVVSFLNRSIDDNQSASAMIARQRDQVIDDLDAAISSLPSAQQQAFKLVAQLLKRG